MDVAGLREGLRGGREGQEKEVLHLCCPVGWHQPRVAIENSQCDSSELRLALSIEYTPDFTM